MDSRNITDVKKIGWTQISKLFDKSHCVVVTDDRSEPGYHFTDGRVAVLLQPYLFEKIQAIIKWYVQQEASRDPRLVENLDINDEDSFPSMVEKLAQFIDEQKKETRLPELSDEDYDAFEKSISEVLQMRESPSWNRPVPDLKP